MLLFPTYALLSGHFSNLPPQVACDSSFRGGGGGAFSSADQSNKSPWILENWLNDTVTSFAAGQAAQITLFKDLPEGRLQPTNCLDAVTE